MKNVFRWIGRRAKEPTTYAGLAAIASAVGLHGVSSLIGQVGTAAVLILGGGLVAHQQGGDKATEALRHLGGRSVG